MMTGRRHSLTTQQRMSQAQRARWADPEYHAARVAKQRARYPVPPELHSDYVRLMRKGFRRAEVLEMPGVAQ